MALKDISEIKPGETVAEDVLNNQNNILIARGVTLTEKHIRILKTWGILAIHIDDPSDKIPQNVSPDELEKLKKVIDKKFELNPEPNPFLDNLKQLLITRHQRNAGAKE